MTTMNLGAGFYSIVSASSGQYDRAALALVVAAIFDVLDGRLARMAHAESKFGSEYDSIADTVSFGVAPAFLAFHAGKFDELGWSGWVMGFMFLAGAALRLARFNVTPQRYPGRFEGLPSPAAAGMVVATVLFVGFLRDADLFISIPAMFPAFGLAVLGLLMVSPIPYHSGKEMKLGGSFGSVSLSVFALVVIFAKPDITLFVLGVIYVASGPVGWAMRMRSGTELEELPRPGASTDSIGSPGTPEGSVPNSA
jgi:CDP-diacylglycerol--serine O-phosphatidyltransferase